MRDSRDWHQNEVFTILSVDTDNVPQDEVKTVIFLDRPIENNHIARPEYQAEVGLLSRSVLVQGSASDSLPVDASTSTCQTYNLNKHFSYVTC